MLVVVWSTKLSVYIVQNMSKHIYIYVDANVPIMYTLPFLQFIVASYIDSLLPCNVDMSYMTQNAALQAGIS